MTEVINLLVSAGTGPEECRIAVEYVIEHIAKSARANEMTCQIANGRTINGKPKSAVVTITGRDAGRFTASYEGTIKCIFDSPVRLGHKRKNWFVLIQRLDNLPDEIVEVDIRPEDLRFDTLRAGGPGGQHQNTTDSAVRVHHIPTGIMVLARDERSQHRNKSLALARLHQILLLLCEDAKAMQKLELFYTHRKLERGNEVLTLKF